MAGQDDNSGAAIWGRLYKTTIGGCDVPTEKIVGGLRIRRIDKFGVKDSPRMSMNYEYESANLYVIPSYVFKLKHEILKGILSHPTEYGCHDHDPDESVTRVVTYFSPVGVQPLQSLQGGHIGYKKVKEIESDGGYTVYEYNGTVKLPANWYSLEDVCVRRIDRGICTVADPEWPVPPAEYDFGRGSLIKAEIFDASSKLLKQTTYTEQYSQNSVGVQGLTTSAWELQGITILPTHYQIKSGRLDWKKAKEKVFDDFGNAHETETITYFSSPYHNMQTSTTVTAVNGLVETKYLYVPDLTECNTLSECAQAYLTEINNLAGEYALKLNTCGTVDCYPDQFLAWTKPISPCGIPQDTQEWRKKTCMEASWHDYQFRLNMARQTYAQCLRDHKEDNQCITNGINNSADPGVRSLYLMEKGNQLELVESSSWQESIFQNATFFDYQFDPLNNASINLKNIYATELAGPTSIFFLAKIANGSIQRDGKYRSNPLFNYLYQDGQPVEITNAGGVTTSYIWGFGNTVPVVKGVGTTYSILKAAYDSSPANIRNDASLAGAQVTTYSHDPIVGIKSATDANGRTMTYEYDKFGRLIRVKDPAGKVVEQYEYKYKVE